MSVQLDHTIVWCRDKQRSADFLVQLLGLPPPVPFGPMLVVQLDNGVSLDYYNDDPPIASQHYAFMVAADDFEPILQRIRQRGLAFWADPGKQRPNEINRHDGGRRVYFDDPDGHLLEVFSQT
jgi:catechol 2,3-dioxygenase-like lactoylglutathione lyase family enzyme